MIHCFCITQRVELLSVLGQVCLTFTGDFRSLFLAFLNNSQIWIKFHSMEQFKAVAVCETSVTANHDLQKLCYNILSSDLLTCTHMLELHLDQALVCIVEAVLLLSLVGKETEGQRNLNQRKSRESSNC